jgi:hypothetical protein
VIVAGALLVGATALAQTAGPSVGPDIVPLTGPSPASGTHVPATLSSTMVPAAAAAPKGAAVQEGATVAKRAASSSSARKTVKVAHKPGSKATVKKAAGPKRVAKATPRAVKPKHVSTTKGPASPRQPTVSAPIPLSKSQPPANGTPPSKPVLPRV